MTFPAHTRDEDHTWVETTLIGHPVRTFLCQGMGCWATKTEPFPEPEQPEQPSIGYLAAKDAISADGGWELVEDGHGFARFVRRRDDAEQPSVTWPEVLTAEEPAAWAAMGWPPPIPRSRPAADPPPEPDDGRRVPAMKSVGGCLVLIALVIASTVLVAVALGLAIRTFQAITGG